MKSVDTSSRLAQILVCVNDRPDSALPCCAEADGRQIYRIFEDWIGDRGLATRIWLTETGCMGWCHADGTTLAFYPDDIWYRAVRPADCETLIERHLHPLLDDADS